MRVSISCTPERRSQPEGAADQDRLPPQHDQGDREQRQRRRHGDFPDAANCGRRLETHQQRHHARGNHGRRRERVEDVLDRQRRHRGSERNPAAHEGGLRRFADERPQRREIADRVAADHGGKRVTERQRVWRLEAQPPRERAKQKPQSADRDDGHQHPPDLSDIRSNFGDADPRQHPRQQGDAANREENAGEG